ncbi:MAG: molybdenum cofactor guanylyltransferase, partial [Gammaproteobacteria bacterium]|nr:molybdenum cofactor guanylyltransferase [Gammaproteobacteria bacterium]
EPEVRDTGLSCGAVVLAGGLARRMDGRDKGLIPLAGMPLAGWALSRVRPQVEKVIINANRNIADYAELGEPVVPDSREGHLGPLAGLLTGLETLETDAVFMCPCDSPFVPEDMVARLAQALEQENTDIAVAHDGQRMQPVFCLVRRSSLESLSGFLDRGERKIDRWFAERSTVTVDFSATPDAFRNINTEAERLEVEQLVLSSDEYRQRVQHDPSCADPSDPELLPVDVARARIAHMLNPVATTEMVPLREALGRILGAEVVSPIDVPSYVNSAMDGYAIHQLDIPASGVARLEVAGTAWAGIPLQQSVKRGQAVRIMTGGMMPEGLDTVVIQEHVETDENSILIDSTVEAGRNVRQAGEDVASGQTVFVCGERIDPSHLGVLASLGIDEVCVYRRLKVAFFTTGDELRSLETHAGQTLGPGELFDSNRYTLFGMLQRLGVEIIDLGVVRDDAELTREAFKTAAASADVILTSGGVSAGDADFVTQIFHEMGQVAFWKLAMRPGRPLAFGRIDNALFFGLPGNPVAVMVTFYEFVMPALKALMGARQLETVLVTALSQSELRKSPGRTEYQRGVLGRDSDGNVTVSTTGKQGAGRLSSMCVADCLIVLPPGQGRVMPGERVEVQPFFGLV